MHVLKIIVEKTMFHAYPICEGRRGLEVLCVKGAPIGDSIYHRSDMGGVQQIVCHSYIYYINSNTVILYHIIRVSLQGLHALKMATNVHAATKLRHMLSSSDFIVALGVYDGPSARIALEVGFDCIYMI
jgi:hypothetical protein